MPRYLHKCCSDLLGALSNFERKSEPARALSLADNFASARAAVQTLQARLRDSGLGGEQEMHHLTVTLHISLSSLALFNLFAPLLSLLVLFVFSSTRPPLSFLALFPSVSFFLALFSFTFFNHSLQSFSSLALFTHSLGSLFNSAGPGSGGGNEAGFIGSPDIDIDESSDGAGTPPLPIPGFSFQEPPNSAANPITVSTVEEEMLDSGKKVSLVPSLAVGEGGSIAVDSHSHPEDHSAAFDDDDTEVFV